MTEKTKASGRGGFRPGSGRPEIGGRVTVCMGPELLGLLDAAAARAGLSRATILRRAAAYYLESGTES